MASKDKEPPKKLTDKQRQFLAELRTNGNITESAETVGMARRTHYKWLDKDPGGVYELAFRDAEEEAADVLERTAWKRGVEGWVEPVFYKGKRVAGEGVIKYDNKLLLELLRARRPSRWRPGHQESGTVEGVTPQAFAERVCDALREIEDLHTAAEMDAPDPEGGDE